MRELETLDKQISDLRTDLNELKNAQFISGASWIFNRILTGKNPDISMSGLAINDTQTWRIVFTPDAEPTAANFILFNEIWTQGHRLQIIPTQGGANHSWDLRYTANAAPFDYTAQVLIESPQLGVLRVSRIA